MAEVGCAGILVADTFCGPMPELPRPGELLACDAIPSSVGGCAANVAIDLRRQGVEVEVAGCVGDDAAANVVTDGLQAHDVGCDRIASVAGVGTSKTIIVLIEGEDRRYIHTFGANAAFTVDHIDRDWVAGLDLLYVGGLFLMPAFSIDSCIDLLQFCRRRGVHTVVDVVIGRDEDVGDDAARLLPHTDCFLPNDDEAEKLTGETDPKLQAQALHRMGAPTVVVTCGERGAVAVRDGGCWTVPIYSGPVVDPSGAGDAFAAGVVTGMVRDWPLQRTLQYASALGVSAVSAVGTTAGVFDAAAAEEFVNTNPLELRRG